MSNAPEKKRQLREAFNSAKTLQESLHAFKKMEESKCFQVSELGIYCFPLATKLYKEGNDSEKVLSLGKMAFQSLELMISRDSSVKITCTETGSSTSNPHFHHLTYVIAQVLNLLGSACLDLKRLIESLRYFERADMILSELEKEGNNCLLSMLESTQLGLFDVKKLMGRVEEAAPHFRKVSEIREKALEEGCMELGRVYDGGLEQNGLARSIMKKMSPSSHDLLSAEYGKGEMLTEMGRHEEAIGVLKGVVSRADVEASTNANALTSMARASFGLGKYDDAKMYMRRAQRIYEKEEMDPLSVAAGFDDMSILYADMNDRETAISLLRRVIAIPKIPQKLLLQSSTNLFLLVFLVGKEEAIPYMEDAVEKLKDSVGLKHYKVGYGCKMLGLVYGKSGQPELAIKCLTMAKEITDVFRGPDHLESLQISHSLALTYALMRRLEPALAIEEKVVEGLKKLVPSEQDFLDNAVELLKCLNTIKRVMADPAWPLINDLFPNLMR